MNIKLILVIGIGVICNNIFGQCNEELLEKAGNLVSNDEVIIKDYKIKLNTASIDEPAPVAKFTHKLENGKLYRLRILSDKLEHNSTGILRLFENNKFLGTTYADKIDKHFEYFDFKCQKSGNYRLLITFQNGQSGCAVVVITEIK
jgi:mRNA-degrading endonuclease RelE of RelBE toxin-antitoxin system